MTTPTSALQNAVAEAGGYVNAHAHLDRAFTITAEGFSRSQVSLKEKWTLVDEVKRSSTQQIYQQRIAHAVEALQTLGTVACGTFIDVDDVAEDRALKAALDVKRSLAGEFPLVLINQTLKGVLNPTARRWFDIGAEAVDIIGGLPKKDAPNEARHLDVLLATGKRLGKQVHVHVDQFNDQAEHETELLAQKTIDHGMEGRVWAVHSISLAAHPQTYRARVYKLLKQAGVGVIACPWVWIDTPRSESIQPFHNSIAPIEELLEHDIPVALGTDNIADLIHPFCEGDMWLELRLAIQACRMYNVPADTLVDLVTTNPRRSLGLSSETSTHHQSKELAHA